MTLPKAKTTINNNTQSMESLHAANSDQLTIPKKEHDKPLKISKNAHDQKSTLPEDDVFSDVEYICSANSLVVDFLNRGLDVVQLPNGDILIREVKVTNTQYRWNKDKKIMMRIS